jgi:hypothetical protein
MRKTLALVFAAMLALPVFASTALAASSDTGTVYWDRGSCLGTADGNAAGSVTFTRDGKWLSGTVSLSGVPDGAYGMLVFVENAGTCPQGNGVFVGGITVAGGSGTADLNSIKLLGNRDGHDVTVVLCIGGNGTGVHFAEPVTLGP